MKNLRIVILMLFAMFSVVANAGYTAPTDEEVQKMYENAKAMMERGSVTDAYPILQEAAAFGSALAATTLATMNASGMGVPENQTQALAWFKVAAHEGYSLAAFAGNSLADTLTDKQVEEATKEAERLLKVINENLKNRSEDS